MQKEIKIGDVTVYVIAENDTIYYPITYVMEKVLLKKNSLNDYKGKSQHIKKFKIDYGLYTGGVQTVNCINEEGLKEILSNSRLGKLSIEQKKAMNCLLEYLHMDLISEDVRFLKKISNDLFNNYNEYINDCINHVITQEENIVWQRCSKCGNYYPYHTNFFTVNVHGSKEHPLYTNCRNCIFEKKTNRDSFVHPNKELKLIYNKYGEYFYILYRDHLDTIEIYNHWLNDYRKSLPAVIDNDKDKIEIVKYCYEKGMFNDCNDLTSKTVFDVCKFKLNSKGLLKEIQKEILGVATRNGQEYIDNIDDAKKVFFNYLEKNNIVIEDVCNYTDYYQTIKDAYLRGYMARCYENSLLDLIMDLYDNKYPAYKFKIRGEKYWKTKDNRIRALKYFIEEEMRMPLEKVPLYVTLTSLRTMGGSTTLYGVCKRFYNKLFDWVEEVYPNVFNEMDFNIHHIRNNFDSIEEAEIHDILKEQFENVIYNPRNTDRTITIGGMIPDWFVFTNYKCYIVEYFGMAVNRITDNKRVSEYQEKTKNKIDKYNNIKNYGKLYIYPDDLKNNFKGLKKKLKMVK